MEPAHIASSFAVLALGVAACGGPDTHMRPEFPSDVTTTTGAPAATVTPAPSVQITQPSPSPPSDELAADSRPVDKGASPSIGTRPMAAPSVDRATKWRDVPSTFTDAEIVAVLEAAGRAERQLARDAAKRAQSPHVRQLAQRVLSDRSEAKLERLERVAALSPVDSATSTELRSNGMRAEQSLRSSGDAVFDQRYVDELAGQERTLMDLLDRDLLPQAQSEELRSLLLDLRTAASSRLGMAQAAGAQ